MQGGQFRDLLSCSFVSFIADDVTTEDTKAQRDFNAKRIGTCQFSIVDQTVSVGISRVGQIAINVHDLDRATAFERDKLGLSLLFTDGQLAFFDCGGVCLMLDIAEKPEFDHPSSILGVLPAAAEAYGPRRCGRDDPPLLPRRGRNGYFGSLPFSASIPFYRGATLPEFCYHFFCRTYFVKYGRRNIQHSCLHGGIHGRSIRHHTRFTP